MPLFFWRGNNLETSFVFLDVPLAFWALNLPNFCNQNRLGLPTTMPCWMCVFLTCHWAVVPTSDRWPKALIALQDRVFSQLSPGDERRFFIYDIIIRILLNHCAILAIEKCPVPQALPNFLKFETSTTFTWKIAIGSLPLESVKFVWRYPQGRHASVVTPKLMADCFQGFWVGIKQGFHSFRYRYCTFVPSS